MPGSLISCLKQVWMCLYALQAVDQSGPPGCNGVVLELNNVWWLDISGHIQGM
jgi:hypothetical protein